MIAAKLLQTIVKHSKGRKKTGFTLTELLVTIIIAGLIVSTLLSFVVELVQTERRENARSTTQQDMQTALDFMVNDVRDAVYIYDNIEQNRNIGGGSIPPLKNFLPAALQSYVPVLAFWKVDRVPYQGTELNCGSTQECTALKIRRRAYTLVVYLQATNTGDDLKKWKGKSRIIRYQLRKYDDPKVENLAWSKGYADPYDTNPPGDPNGKKSSFDGWPYGGAPPNPLQQGTPDNTSSVLVDFVDHPTEIPKDLAGNLKINKDELPKCDSGYKRVPDEPKSISFFTCVKTLESDNISNQDVVIYLRGNPEERSGTKFDPMEILKTRAVARGVIDKKS